MKPAICFFEVQDEERVQLRSFRPKGYSVRLFAKKLDDATPADLAGAQVVSVFIYSSVTAQWLKKMPRLKLVATRSTGFDHIDVEACRKKRVAVANVPFYGENTVAEHTFALIMALSRKVHQAYFRTMRGNFSFGGLQGFDLKGKTIGIVGTGNIGIHAIRIAKGFGMNVLAYDVVRNAILAETLGFQYVSLERLLAESEIVSLHVPYRKETHHLINKRNIGRMKKGALLINTARGGLVETEALAIALDNGHLSGAGLDVLEGEDLIKEERQILSGEFSAGRLKTLLQNHILLNRENVVITPHIGFNSKEALLRILEATAGNIRSFIAGSPENLLVSGPSAGS